MCGSSGRLDLVGDGPTGRNTAAADEPARRLTLPVSVSPSWSDDDLTLLELATCPSVVGPYEARGPSISGVLDLGPAADSNATPDEGGAAAQVSCDPGLDDLDALAAFEVISVSLSVHSSYDPLFL